MPERSQKNRLISIKTTVGEDVLLLTAMYGYEALSEPFNFHLELASEKDDIKANDIVGKEVTITLVDNNDKPRYFHGYISHFVAGELRGDGYRAYQAEMVPALWFLNVRVHCRVFQNMSTVDLVEEVTGRSKSSNAIKLKKSLSASYPKREYCVQFNETDFEFISRLMEEDGIFYFFEHTSSGHTMVLADDKSAYKKCPETEAVYLAGHLMENQLTAWSNQYSFITSKHSLKDYNFETPDNKLSVSSKSVVNLPGANAKEDERYVYPGNHMDSKLGNSRVEVRMESEEASYHIVNSGGTYRSYFAGGTFTVKEHAIKSEENKSYVITALSHQASEDSYGTNGGASSYQNQFSCIPSDVLFRPGIKHKRPAVHGPQTAVVVGPKGEEIFTDKYGRVKIQFHWDVENKSDEKSSCWVRVAQTMVGNKWGAIFIPRIGQEVVVSFVDGDLDRPLITGCVYNANFMPPYELPKNKTQSGIKTRSSKGGGTAHFNELRFEDMKGKEQIYFHAEKDFHREVENDDSILIYKNRAKTIKEGNETVVIEKGNHETTLNKGDMATKVAAGKITVEASNSIELKVGGSTIKMTPTSIELKTGSSTVKLDPSGVSTKGTMVKVAGQAMAEVKSPMTTVKGDGMLTLKGGVIMIN